MADDTAIFKAYDETSHVTFINAAVEKGVNKLLIAAWVREFRSMASSIKLGKLSTRYVSRERSLIQGDPAAPYLFNASLDSAIVAFTLKCDEQGWGYLINEVNIPILVFADNFWILSKSPSHLQDMFQCWLLILAERGWQVPVPECTWCTTASDDTEGEIVDMFGQVVKRASRSVGFKALGSWISFDNSSSKEIEYRIGQCWKAFESHRDMLCNQRGSLRRRLELLDKVVLPSISWGGATWNPTQKDLNSIWTVQHRMMRIMMGIRRRPGEEGDDFVYCVNLGIKRIRTRFNILTWDEAVLQMRYRFMGHLQRFVTYDEDRLAFRVLSWRGIDWIKEQEVRRFSGAWSPLPHVEMGMAHLAGLQSRLEIFCTRPSDVGVELGAKL